MFKRACSIFLFLSLFLIIFSLSLPNAFAMEEEEKYGGILYRDLGASDILTLDPAHIVDTSSAEVARQIFDGLVEYDFDGNVIPAIAESWDISEDGLTWTFYLRDDVHFQGSYGDGTPTKNGGRKVTAQDFVWSWNRVIDPATRSERANFFYYVANFEAVDDFTFKVTLKQPFTPFLAMLAYSCFYVLPREDVQSLGDFAFLPVGTGAFKLKEWKRGSYIRLVANEKHFRGRPYLDELHFGIAEAGVSITMVQRGLLDFNEISDSLWNAIKEMFPDADKWLVAGTGLGIYYIGFNVTKEPFAGDKGKLVRQAFNYAINKDFITQVLREERAAKAYGALPPGMPGHNPNLVTYDYDPEKAKRLLAEAGYPNGDGLGTIELWCNIEGDQIVEAVRENLEAIGCDIEVKVLNWADFINGAGEGKFQIFRLSWLADYPDPENFLTVLFHSKNRGPNGNLFFYSNPEVDALLDEADTSTDAYARVKLYRQAEKMIMDDAPWIPLYFYNLSFFVNTWVKGFKIPAMGIQDFSYRHLWIDREEKEEWMKERYISS